jgi:hypothetical protein
VVVLMALAALVVLVVVRQDRDRLLAQVATRIKTPAAAVAAAVLQVGVVALVAPVWSLFE